jgi:HD-GYP domain-containing protein (c-di-GMP phosphodiesterase class II)
MARIISVSDVLDAMTTNRPYQSAKDIDEALEVIRKLAGTKFDINVVEALEAIVQAGNLRVAPALVEV